MLALIDEMANSIDYWVTAAYRANQPEIAQDRSPAMVLRQLMRRLARRWQKRFDGLAQNLGAHYATETARRSDAALRSSLKKAGFTVEFKLTKTVNDILQASIAQNVSLIRSIPQQHMHAVEGAVMRSVQAGRDLSSLVTELRERHDVTRDRATLIARQQVNAATATVTRARQQEMGLTEAEWVHSAGGKHPRPEHVKAGRDHLRYDVTKGAYLEGKWIWPGTEINCRCVSRPVIPGVFYSPKGLVHTAYRGKDDELDAAAGRSAARAGKRAA
nr:phage minor head protein [uncultured Lichenicoccus sp.]